MAEQIPQRAELQTMTPEAAKTIEFSPATVASSASVAEKLRDNSRLTLEDIEKLLQNASRDLDRDLSKRGTALTSEEKHTWQKKVVDLYDRFTTVKNHEAGAIPSDERINMADYLDTFGNLMDVYGHGDVGAKLKQLEHQMIASSVIESFGLSSLLSISYQFQDKRLIDDFKRFGNFGQASAGEKVRSVFSALRTGIPLAAIVGLVPALIVDVRAQNAMGEPMGMIKKRMNERITNSLFMRDFEFIHDKPAAEILNILDKGKDGVMDLLTTSYERIFPSLGVIGVSSLHPAILRFPGGIPVTVYNLLRLPTLMRSSSETAQQLLHNRKQDMTRKELIEGRIIASLQSLEVVKTSDSMEEAIAELQKTMEERDTLRTGAHKLTVQQGKKGSLISMLLTYASPVVGAGSEFLMSKLSGLPTGESLAQAGLTAGVSYAGQLMVDGAASSVVNGFIEKIHPALQDIKRMEELLGPYDQVDTPEGPREKARMAVSGLNNFDISVKNLSFKDILHDVSLDIPQGSFVTIKGPSGIGKTTFFRHLMGLYGAREGAVQYGGVDLQKIKKFGEQSIYSKIAYANQNPQFFENMTLRENLLLWTKKPATDIEIRQTLHDLRLDGLIDRLDSKVKHYSGGELRRIGIARALLKDPRVLFLDEPTANLDEESAKQVLEIIKGLRVKRPEMTVVAVTHDPNFEAIAERIVDFKEINRKPEIADGQVLVGQGKSDQSGPI